MYERVHFYIHHTARDKHKRESFRFAQVLPNAVVHDLILPFQEFPDNADAAVVVGGDGSVRSVAEKIIEKDNPAGLFVVAGGSQNGLYRSLIHEGVTVEKSNFQNQEFPTLADFRPGQIDGHIFLHVAELGRIMVAFRDLNERLRTSKIPRTYRLFVAAIMVGFNYKHEDTNEPLLRIFATGPNLGILKVLPRQQLYSDSLAMITVENMIKPEMVGKLVTLLYSLALKKRLPQELAKTTYAQEFKIPHQQYSHNTLGIGGDIFPKSSESEIVVRRSEKSIQTAALKL